MTEQDLRDKIKYEIGDNCQHSSYCSKKLCQTNDGVVCFVDAQTVDKCVQIAKDYADAQKEQEAIEFASFLRRHCQADNNFLYWWYAGEKYNEKQLYQLFKNRENER